MPLLHNSNYFRIHQNFSTSFAMILFQKMYSASQPIKKSFTFFIISQPIYIYSCNRNWHDINK